MNVLLVQPSMNWHQTYCESPSRALLLLGTIAEKAGHKVKIVHLDIASTPLPDTILDFQPDLVGITVNTFQVKSARNIVKLIRSISKAKIIIGGPHAVVWEDEQKLWPESDKVDGIVIGEGEDAWLGIVGGSTSAVDINYNLIDLSKFVGVNPLGAFPSVAIMGSRGCPNECTFCNTPIFWGKKVRYRDPGSVVDEVERLNKDFGVNEVFFQDDTFNINHKWAFEIFEDLIRRGLSKRMVFKIDCRVNEEILTDEFLEMAHKAGVWNIFFGVESGSQQMLDSMKKNITVPEIKRAFALTQKHRINTQASFIVGLPGESWNTLNETAKLIIELKSTWFGWCYFSPFPCTEAARIAKEKGHIRETDYGNYSYGKVMCRTDVLDYDDLTNFKGFLR